MLGLDVRCLREPENLDLRQSEFLYVLLTYMCLDRYSGFERFKKLGLLLAFCQQVAPHPLCPSSHLGYPLMR